MCKILVLYDPDKNHVFGPPRTVAHSSGKPTVTTDTTDHFGKYLNNDEHYDYVFAHMGITRLLDHFERTDSFTKVFPFTKNDPLYKKSERKLIASKGNTDKFVLTIREVFLEIMNEWAKKLGNWDDNLTAEGICNAIMSFAIAHVTRRLTTERKRLAEELGAKLLAGNFDPTAVETVYEYALKCIADDIEKKSR